MSTYLEQFVSNSFFRNFPDGFIKQKIPQFPNKHEDNHQRYLNLLQIKIIIIFQPECIPNMIKRAISANKPIDHNINEVRSKQSMVPEKTVVKLSKENINTRSQSQIQTIYSVSNPNINKTKITETIPPIDVTKSSPPTSSTLIQIIIHHCKLQPKFFKALLILRVIQIFLRCLHLKINL